MDSCLLDCHRTDNNSNKAVSEQQEISSHMGEPSNALTIKP